MRHRALLTLMFAVAAGAAAVACRSRESGAGSDASVEAAAARTLPLAGSAASGSVPSGPEDAGPSDAASTDGSGRDAGRRPRSLACDRPPAGPRAFRATIARPEGPRAFEVRLPEPSTKPARVLFAIHPFGSSALEYLRATHLTEVFGPKNWAIVAPEGERKSFNGGDCCGDAAKRKLDDVGLLLAIADDLAERACVDVDRVYAAGFSNGGFMSQALACAHADRVGAVASVGAVLGVTPCEPKEPVSVLLVNGIGDDVIPPDGGGPFRTKPLAETIATWRRVSECAGDAGVTKSPVGAVCRAESCAAGRTLEVCTVPYAHVWMVKSHPAGDSASAKQTAHELLEFFDRRGTP